MTTVDTAGKRIGLITVFLAVFLSIFTLAAHHTQAQIMTSQHEFNDKWFVYQSKRISDDQLEMNTNLMKLVAIWNPQSVDVIESNIKKHEATRKELTLMEKETEENIQKQAIFQKKANYFDFAENILFIAFVMNTLYFAARKKIFPVLGFLFGLSGIMMGISGFIL